MRNQEVLTSPYRENPCQVLANALWKTLASVDHLQTSSHLIDGKVTHFEAWGKDGLYTYWDRAKAVSDTLPQKLHQVSFALLHQDYLNALPAPLIDHFAMKESYFRLIFRGKPAPPLDLPPGFRIERVHTQKQATEVSDLISTCYESIHPAEDEVKSWTQHPVFDPDLWIWLIDENTGKPAALGIAEADQSISEGSLEWIQVLPAYHGRGLGKALVAELLNRLQNRAAFTTVSGAVDNNTTPEILYRKCGFEGNDVWWVLRR